MNKKKGPCSYNIGVQCDGSDCSRCGWCPSVEERRLSNLRGPDALTAEKADKADKADKVCKTVDVYDETTVSRGDGRDLVIICNEEGKLRGMAHNVTIYGEDFVGPILVVGVDGEDFVGPILVVGVDGEDFVGPILVVGVDGEDFDDLPLTWQEMKTLYSEFWEV